MVAPDLRLHPGQEALTPAQEAEARRFAQERIAAYLSATPIDEPEAERLLREVYAIADLTPPRQIPWLDGPLQLVAVMAPQVLAPDVRERVGASLDGVSGEHVWNRVRRGVSARVSEQLVRTVGYELRRTVRRIVGRPIRASVWATAGGMVAAQVAAEVGNRLAPEIWEGVTSSQGRREGLNPMASIMAGLAAFYEAHWLAYYHYFDAYLAPNALHTFARFNTLVSGCWLGPEAAYVVRRPLRLSLNAAGRFHSATGMCVEYPDGWGWYAWHGVRVPEKVILHPEGLTRTDFLKERNLEVRRVIQERMGQRFVRELKGAVLDTGPRGALYEVRLPRDDPERVARYIQLQDASTERQYFLRVPPSIQTAAEAVAWSFQLTVEEYAPVHET